MIKLKWVLKVYDRMWTDSSGSGQGQVAVSGELGGGPSGSRKCEELLA